MSWHEDAACSNLPTRIFYPERGRQATLAKTVCDRCPVHTQCQDEGAREPFGVWGRKSVAERGGSLHNRGEPHRLTDVRACTECDARVWVERNIPASGFRCEACRFDDEDVA